MKFLRFRWRRRANKERFKRRALRFKAKTTYGSYLTERRQFLRAFGGFSQRTLVSYVTRASEFPGKFNENLLLLLERRLDVVLYRLRFCESIAQARQLIHHGKVVLNGVVSRSVSYECRPGDLIQGPARLPLTPVSRNDHTISAPSSAPASDLQGPKGLVLKGQGRSGFCRAALFPHKPKKRRRDRTQVLKDHADLRLKRKPLAPANKNRSRFENKRHKRKKPPRKKVFFSLNAEASYRLGRALFLFAPQKIRLPRFFNLLFLRRSLRLTV